MPLTDTAVRQAKPGPKPYKLADGGGLYLLVNPTGGKLWRWKYRFGGKEKLLALGVYPDVGLKVARDKHLEARKLLADGADPGEAKQSAKRAERVASENSFESVARAWLVKWAEGKSQRHVEYTSRRLEADVFPEIGRLPVSTLGASRFRDVVLKVERRGTSDLPGRVWQMCGQVMRYAVAHDLAERNPIADVRPGDFLKSAKTVNYARVNAAELPALLRAMDGYTGRLRTRLAIKLLSLTFVRTSELIEARRAEFDLDAARWNIPAERMKMGAPHIVPLSSQAVDVVRQLFDLGGGNELLFRGDRDHEKPMSNNTILKALERMGYKGTMTGHGFRGVASTLLHEQGYPHEHIETQLAHAERNAVSAAYNHAQYLPQRAKMMQAWADHLDMLKIGGNVVPLTRARAA